MKFLKSLFLKLKAKKTLRTYQQPLLITLGTLLLINILVLCVGAGIALLIDNHYYDNSFFGGSFLSAFITGSGMFLIGERIINSLRKWQCNEKVQERG